MARVLIVDDQPEQCRPLTRLLQMSGHEASLVECGQAAMACLESADAWRPDLVICDVMMPDMDGVEVLRRIRSLPHAGRIPVVMYTAISDPASVHYLRAIGADDVWIKTRTDLEHILNRVAACVPHRDLTPSFGQTGL